MPANLTLVMWLVFVVFLFRLGGGNDADFRGGLMSLDFPPVCEQLEDRQLMAAALNLAAASPVTLGPTDQISQYAYHAAGASDLYTFTAPATGTVTIELTAKDGLLDPTLQVLTPANRLLAVSGDISATNRNSRATISVTKGTTYVVAAQGNKNTRGGYYLKLTSTPTDDMGNTRATSKKTNPTTYGTISGPGTVNYANDLDVLSVVAARTGTMKITLKAASNAQGFLPKVTAYDASGQVLACGSADAGGGQAVTLAVTAKMTYYIGLEGKNSTIGGYAYSGTITSGSAFIRVSELAASGPVTAPIRLGANFLDEQDLYGYTPLFEPSTPSFGPDNQTYIRTAFDTANPAIQVLNGGQWVRLDLRQLITKKVPGFKDTIFTGPGHECRIVFDKDGDAYFPLETSAGAFLLHSHDQGQNWDVNAIAGPLVRVEYSDGGRLLDGPPAILSWPGGSKTLLDLQVPIKNADGTLTIPPSVRVTDYAFPPGAFVGGSNSVVTVGGKVHVVWADTRALTSGTTAWGATYDKTTHQLGQPVNLGVTGSGAPDAHRIPVLEVDSQNYIHLLLGSHNDNITYKKSLLPNSLSTWSAPTILGPGWSNTLGLYTYPSMVIDSHDTLHLVVRSYEAGTRYNLVYMTKPAGQPWQAPVSLVLSGRVGYCLYTQQLSIDLNGRLFLNYSEYYDQMTTQEAAAYRERFPDDVITPYATDGGTRSYFTGLTCHDPAMIMSDDAGKTWHLATTPDFVKGLTQLK